MIDGIDDGAWVGENVEGLKDGSKVGCCTIESQS